MKRQMQLALVMLYTVAAASCATMNAGFHVDRNVDFSQYRTWDWESPDALPVGDPRLAANPFFKDHFEGAVEKRLASLGLIRAPSGLTPNLRVHYHASITQRVLVNESNVNCVTGDCQPQTIEYEQGTLVLDVIDARLNKLVWRGWAQDGVKPALENEDRMDRQIREAVAKLLAHFPQSF